MGIYGFLMQPSIPILKPIIDREHLINKFFNDLLDKL